MAWTKTRIVTVAAAVLLVGVTVPMVVTRPSANVVKAPDGRLAKLERYEFQAVKLAAPVNEPGMLSSETQVPYSLLFEVPDGAHELNPVVAVSQSRFLEFLVKPEQVND